MTDRPVLFRRRSARVYGQIAAVHAALALSGCTTYGGWLLTAGQDAGGASAQLAGGVDGSADLPPVSGGSAEAGAAETGDGAAGGSDSGGSVSGGATPDGSDSGTADASSADAGNSAAGAIATGGSAGTGGGGATGGVGRAGEAGSTGGGAGASNTSGGAGASSAGSGNAGSAGAATRELARRKPVTASSQQVGHPPEYGNDNDTNTAWCAVNEGFPQWWRVDLGAVYALISFSSTWGTPDRTYSYKIETSNDGSVWLLRATITEVGTVQPGIFPPGTSGRYVRVTVTYATPPSWACFAEFSFVGQ